MGLLGRIKDKWPDIVAITGGIATGVATGSPTAGFAAYSGLSSLGDAIQGQDGKGSGRGTQQSTFVSPFSGAPGETSPYTNEGGSAAIANFERAAASTGTNFSTMPDYSKYTAHNKAVGILGAVGISGMPRQGYSPVGSDFSGATVYSSDALKNSVNMNIGKDSIQKTGTLFGSVGVFKDLNEATTFNSIGEKSSDPLYVQQLDSYKSAGDAKGFKDTLATIVPEAADPNESTYTSFKLFENWNLLSPAQKSAAVAAVGIQSYKFSDGTTLGTKQATPSIPNTMSLSLADVTKLAGSGVNVAPAVNNWAQLTAIQDTFYTPESADGVVTNMASLGMLGVNDKGAAVNIDSRILGSAKAVSTPQYGVGAVSVPKNTGNFSGYVKVASIDDKDIFIPSVNRSTAVIKNPVVATDNSAAIYRSWSDTGKSAAKGAVGGSALVGSLHAMAEMNPYSLSAVVVQDAFSNQDLPEEAPSDMATVANLMNVTFNRLKYGKAEVTLDKEDTLAAFDAPKNKQSFDALRKLVRGEYAAEGISSKESGYQLANQAYAEGRINDTQLVSAQKTLDMLYDDNGYIVAEKLLLGKNKGIDIARSRRG